MVTALLLFLGMMMPKPSAPIEWRFSAAMRADGLVEVHCDAVLDEGWHVYATELPSNEGPIATTISITPSDQYGGVLSVIEPEPKEEYDPNFAIVVRYHAGAPRFTVLLRPVANTGIVVRGELEYMVCNDKTCLPPVVVPFEVSVQAESDR